MQRSCMPNGHGRSNSDIIDEVSAFDCSTSPGKRSRNGPVKSARWAMLLNRHFPSRLLCALGTQRGSVTVGTGKISHRIWKMGEGGVRGKAMMDSNSEDCPYIGFTLSQNVAAYSRVNVSANSPEVAPCRLRDINRQELVRANTSGR